MRIGNSLHFRKSPSSRKISDAKRFRWAVWLVAFPAVVSLVIANCHATLTGSESNMMMLVEFGWPLHFAERSIYGLGPSQWLFLGFSEGSFNRFSPSYFLVDFVVGLISLYGLRELVFLGMLRQWSTRDLLFIVLVVACSMPLVLISRTEHYHYFHRLGDIGSDCLNFAMHFSNCFFAINGTLIVILRLTGIRRVKKTG